MTKASRPLAAGGLLLAVVAGVSAWRAYDRREVVEVQTRDAVRTDLAARVSASGEVRPRRFVDVGANVSGRITSLRVEEGDAVRAGQVLARIDSTRFEAATRQAEAALEAQQAELERALAELAVQRLDTERAERMWSERLVAEQVVDAARAQLRIREATAEALRKRIAQQEAVLASSRDDLEKTTVVAPMDGVVTRLDREEGEVVIGAQSFNPTIILTVADLSEMECEVMVDESDIADVALGQKAEVEVDALRDRVIRGRVIEIGASAQVRGGESGSAAASSASTGTQAKEFRVAIALEEPPAELRPGLNASARIETGRREGALAVPIQSVVVRSEAGALADPDAPVEAVERAEREGVFVVEEGVAHFRTIRTGMLGDADVEVLEGLSGGESVVSGPYRTLRTLEDGDRVEVVEPGADGSRGSLW